ncbi:hypothetical protein KIN20_005049 [Parelaphostrongylus tenuis]|uniref:Uncharacterized protein n=1 Tax=Parelaphostrongylus tenuis TaxID=148309 RepID=A0AAD5MKS7_PARTN|nr:hypothetical protein KIN20_005049 [Parelaphostrongylus tenuis]
MDGQNMQQYSHPTTREKRRTAQISQMKSDKETNGSHAGPTLPVKMGHSSIK